jgi:hypothetical protein
MLISIRTLRTAWCVALVAVAGCGGRVTGPTAPSDVNGSTIAGVVNGGQVTSASTLISTRTAAAAPSGMTVTVAGTNLSVSVDVMGQFQLTGVPSGSVQLVFRNGTVAATVQVSDVGDQELIQLQVNVSGSSATIVNEVRSTGKVALCHSTGNGQYHQIEVSVNAEPAHRDHGDGKVGDPVPADTTQVFDSSCRPVNARVTIVKSTNGEDANDAPGPTVMVGSPVAWQYVVTNTGTVSLTDVQIVDDRNVTVNCAGRTTLAVGESMTCTGSGVATAGQYKNVGTVTAAWSAGTVTDSDASHYFGQTLTEPEGPKVQLCHRTGNGSYHLIEVAVSAEPAHRAHGDGKIGENVPNQAGTRFGAGCAVQ